MCEFNTQYQITVEIFTKIYGYAPNNLKKDMETANNFFTIQKMINRMVPIFSNLWQDINPNINFDEPFDAKLAELLKIEITYRYYDSQKHNNQRTRLLNYVNEELYEKISAEALRYFFLPYFQHYQSLNLQYFVDFEKNLPILCFFMN